jgi:hypothetical protein
MLDRFCEYLASLLEVIAGIEQVIEPGAVLGPLLDLVEVSQIGFDRVVGLFVPQHRRRHRSSSLSDVSLTISQWRNVHTLRNALDRNCERRRCSQVKDDDKLVAISTQRHASPLLVQRSINRTIAPLGHE